MDSEALRDLELFISNNRYLMTKRLPEFIKNMARKMARGTYDPKQAPKLFRYLVDEAAKLYAKEYSVGTDWARIFSVPTRNALAAELADDYAQQIRDGNWSHVLDEAKIKMNPTARKKRVSKKKAAPRKKSAAKKKTTARKKVAINAPSRATGKPPSKRLRSRRARNTVPGAYPNPAPRKGYSVAVATDGIVYWLTPRNSLSSKRLNALAVPNKGVARSLAGTLPLPPGFGRAQIAVVSADTPLAAIRREVFKGKK